MNDERYRVRQLARLARVTVRTLHHYDRIGLLVPSERTEAGYRVYRRADLLRLQQVLVYRELGLSLEEIRRVLDDPGRDEVAALREQRARLEERAREVAGMLRAVDAALRSREGDEDMTAESLFEGFDPARYEAEARERWGETGAYREAARRTAGYREADWVELKEEAADLLRRLAAAMAAGEPAEGAAARALAEEHRLHIDTWFYPCSPAQHLGLAEMYLADARFAAHFEAVAEGLTGYLAAAVRANAAEA